MRAQSSIHFTPVAVARRAVELLVGERGADATILDVGAGAGKLCQVGGLVSPARFVGVEQRRPLVEVARDVAARLALSRVELVHGDAFDLDWRRFSGVYLYNPFAEAIRFGEEAVERFDPTHMHTTYFNALQDTAICLHQLPVGVRVATYHGYGGPMPKGYVAIASERLGTGTLEVWEKR